MKAYKTRPPHLFSFIKLVLFALLIILPARIYTESAQPPVVSSAPEFLANINSFTSHYNPIITSMMDLIKEQKVQEFYENHYSEKLKTSVPRTSIEWLLVQKDKEFGKIIAFKDDFLDCRWLPDPEGPYIIFKKLVYHPEGELSYRFIFKVGENKLSAFIYSVHKHKKLTKREVLHEGRILLSRAIISGDYKVLQAQLARSDIKRIINIPDKQGRTALYYATRGGYSATCLLLLQAGADVNIGDDSNETPLIVAVANNYKKLADIYLRRGANINAKATHTRESSPLTHAIANNDFAYVKKLIALGADINLPPGGPISLAVETGNLQMIRYLLKIKVKLNTQWNPLFEAAVRGRVKAIKLLLEAGAEINKVDHFGNTALDKAIDHNETQAIRVLLEAGINPNIKNNIGGTVFLSACLSGNIELARLLIKFGAHWKGAKNKYLSCEGIVNSNRYPAFSKFYKKLQKNDKNQ